MAMVSQHSSSGMGSGGMASKIEAARIATGAGCDLIIASGLEPHPIARIDAGAARTLFVASAKAKARKAWLAGRLTVRGSISVDAGATKALRSGASLLASGIVQCTETFVRGDVVDLLAPGGEAIARGLAEYDSGDIARIAGRKSDAIEEVLGYAPRSAVVHRDHMVRL